MAAFSAAAVTGAIVVFGLVSEAAGQATVGTNAGGRTEWLNGPYGLNSPEVRESVAVPEKSALAPLVAATSLAPAGIWVEIGPAPAHHEPMSLFGVREDVRRVVGRVSAVAVDPENADRWLVGGALGGVWETRDQGRTWKPLTDTLCTMAIGAIAFGRRAGSGQRAIYIGTGEAITAGFVGAGLLRSDDDGRGWQRLVPPSFVAAEGPGPCVGASNFDGHPISNMHVAPDDDRHVVVSVRHAGVRVAPGSKGGIWRCTPEQSGTGITCARELLGGGTDLVVHPQNFGRMYAGVVGVNPQSRRSGVYRRSEYDGQWIEVPGPWKDKLATLRTSGELVGIGRVRIAIAPSRPDTVYVAISLRSEILDAGGNLSTFKDTEQSRLLGLWRTHTAWAKDLSPAQWQEVDTADTDGGSGKHGYCAVHPESGLQEQCYHNNVLSVDPGNPAVLYAGGIGLWKTEIDPNCRGAVCSARWEEISHMVQKNPRVPRILKRGIHADQQALVWSGPHRLIVGNDGGTWSTTNGGRTWTDHNVGLGVLQFWNGAVEEPRHGARDYRDLVILGGAQDNGSIVWTGSSWRWVKGGDGVGSVIDSSAPRDRWALLYQSALEGGGGAGQVAPVLRRTLDGGAHFLHADANIAWVPPILRQWVVPVTKCLANDDVVLVGTTAVWRTTRLFSSRIAPTWSQAWVVPGPGQSLPISAIAFAPSGDCNIAAVATGFNMSPTEEPNPNDVAVFLLRGAGQQSTKIDAPPLPKSRPVTALMFDPKAPNVLYVTYGGKEPPSDLTPGHIFRAEIDLATGTLAKGWVRLDANVDLAAIPVHTIAMRFAEAMQAGPDWVEIFAGTQYGVLVGRCHRFNPDCSWVRHTPRQHCMPGVPVVDIKISRSRHVIAFTYGRGAFAFLESSAEGRRSWCGGRRLGAIGTSFGDCSKLADYDAHLGRPCLQHNQTSGYAK